MPRGGPPGCRRRDTTDAGCPACTHVGARPVASNRLLTLVGCPRCELVYLHPQPRTRVRQKYLEEYDLAAHFGALAPRKRVLYERRLSRLPGPAPGRDRLCDVGCGDGQFLELARQRGWQPYGVEMNPPAARRASERGARVATGVLEELDALEWGTFDLVTSWDVLEHTPEPRRFAERLVRLLAPGGTLVVTTLNLPSLAWRVFGMKWSMVCEDHFTYWNRKSLAGLFGALGLVVTDIEIFGLGRDFVTALDRLGGRSAPPDSTASSRDGGWDVSPTILRIEGALNQVFQRLGGGVGIGLTMRPPHPPVPVDRA